jgi:hypothetical protein
MKELPIVEPVASISDSAEKAVRRPIEFTSRQQQTRRRAEDARPAMHERFPRA